MVAPDEPGEWVKCAACGGASHVPAAAGADLPSTPIRRSARKPFFVGFLVGSLVGMLALVGVAWWIFQSAMTSLREGKAAETLAAHFKAPPVPGAVPEDYDWQFQSLDGAPLDAESLRGRVLFVNMWATWCPPCIAELPSIAHLQEQVHARLGEAGAEAVAFLCVSSEPAEKVRAFERLGELGLPAYVLAGGTPPEFETSAIPATFILDASGRIVFQHVGAARWDDPSCVDYLVALAGQSP